MASYLFSSESVTEGHPDKLCDAVSDAVLDACLAQDPNSRVACETATKTGFVLLLGEITTKANLDYNKIARKISVRVPTCVNAPVDEGFGVVVMRDLIADGARFCTALEPFDADRAAASLEQLARLHRIAREKGRDPKTISTSVFRAPPDKATLTEYEEAGIDRAVLEIPDESRDDILRVLDRYAPLLK